MITASVESDLHVREYSIMSVTPLFDRLFDEALLEFIPSLYHCHNPTTSWIGARYTSYHAPDTVIHRI